MATVLAIPVGVVRSLSPSMLFLIHLLLLLGTSTPPESGCICPGETLTYKCGLAGIGLSFLFRSTTKTLFCSGSNDKVVILRYDFSDGGTLGSCNNRSIVARSLPDEEDQWTRYTLKLYINITLDEVGKTIECYYNERPHHLRKVLLVLSTSDPPPAPSEVEMSAVNYSSREITFNWSPVVSNCPAISYNILSSNCGSCPTTTNHTNVTCTDVFVPTGKACTFAVQTVADSCGRITRNTSKTISVNLASLINLDTHINQASIISIISLAAVLMVSLVVSITVIVICCIIVTSGKAEIKALKLQQTTTSERRSHMESTYDDVIHGISSIGTISTQNNSSYDDVIRVLSAINTQDNSSYRRTNT